ncbi:MAG: GGDEF domain-containing protein [Pseudomonadota bacterium]
MQTLYFSPMLLGLMMLIAISIAATALWQMTRPREGPGFWMAGSLSLLTGVLLFLLFTITRNPAVNVLANALQMAGEAIFLLGIFRFMGRPLPYWIVPVSVLVVVVFNLHYWITDGNSDFLMGVYSTVAGLLPVQAIWLLLRERRDPATRPARMLVGLSLLVYSVVTLARGGLAYRDWWLEVPYVQPYESFSYLLPYNFAIPALVMGFVGVTLMTMQRVLDELNSLARVDPLTGALNRRSLTETFERELLRLQRHPRPLALAMLDLDHFKDINDRHGHTPDRWHWPCWILIISRTSTTATAISRGIARYSDSWQSVARTCGPRTGSPALAGRSSPF